MKKASLLLTSCAMASLAIAQTNPAITAWLQNTTLFGSHYIQNNFTPIQDNVLVNVQTVQYSANWAYATTNGIPSYTTGPFFGNPSQATDQNAIFKFPLSPTQNTGNPAATTGGNIGVFINGVALFDYRDGVSYKLSTAADAGGPLGGMGDGVWNRDAVPAERIGFDCAKGHPAMGNYHHHQNPSAFDLDLVPISTVCSLYAADGLYVIDSAQHSPLIGFAYDGFPIYGAYAYTNVNGTGSIKRMKSSYWLSTNTTRTNGPAVNAQYPAGCYCEDYTYIPVLGDLDEHNGRFCITPDYPNGTYCYFVTIDAQLYPTFPFVLGPTYYGTVPAGNLGPNGGHNVISEPTTTYTGTTAVNENLNSQIKFQIMPNPVQDYAYIYMDFASMNNLTGKLYDNKGKLLKVIEYMQPSIAYSIDMTTYSAGIYLFTLEGKDSKVTQKIIKAK